MLVFKCMLLQAPHCTMTLLNKELACQNYKVLFAKFCENISTCWEAIHFVDDGMLIGVFFGFFLLLSNFDIPQDETFVPFFSFCCLI